MARKYLQPTSRDLTHELLRVGVEHLDSSIRRRAEYASDASNYRVLPRAVAFPRSADEIVTIHKVCSDLEVPLTIRGGGTSTAGNAVGHGVIVDCSRHLNRILEVDLESRTATVQPGVVLDDLQRRVAPYGLRFGPEPSTHDRATLGGMVGNNACGSRALRYGRTSENLLSADVLAGNGERLSVRSGDRSPKSPTLAALRDLTAHNLAPIRREFGRFSRQGSGLSLDYLLPEHSFNVPGMLAGSEGTLALVLEATLKLAATPSYSTLHVFGYDDLSTAAEDVERILRSHPVAVEGIDSRIVDIVRSRNPTAVPDLPPGNAWLFVELGANSRDELAAASMQLSTGSASSNHRAVADKAQAARLWRIREDGAGLANRPTRTNAWHAGWEDAAVPVTQLSAYLRRFDELVEAHGLIGFPYGHMGDGCVHVRLDFKLDAPPGITRFREFLTAAADLVAEYGGSMSGEHGDGRARGELLPRMYSSEALSLFGSVKTIFDPRNVLNPGVIVDPTPVDANLRLHSSWRVPIPLGFSHEPDTGDFARAVHRCSGVGRCRSATIDGDDVMCPSFIATRDEKDSTRGRARVLQELVRADSAVTWGSPEVHESLDLCLACKGCSSDCPTGTDMARYKSEVLYQSYKGRLRPASHYSLGRLPTWAQIASKAPRMANRLMASRAGRALGHLAGVADQRVLPEFAHRTFSDRARAELPRGDGTPILLWVDTFTERFQPEVGISATKVLSAAGYDVRTPGRQLCCGLTYISTGQLDKAKRRLLRTVRELREAERADMRIVGLEPSCVATLRGDAQELLDEGEGLIPTVHTLAEILSDNDELRPDLSGLSILAQPHCHHRAVMGWDIDREYLRSLGAEVDTVTGCCGLAGNFGMEEDHFDVSMRIAETWLAPALSRAHPASSVVADGFSCRLQARQLGDDTALHLAQLLSDHLPASAEKDGRGRQ